MLEASTTSVSETVAAVDGRVKAGGRFLRGDHIFIYCLYFFMKGEMWLSITEFDIINLRAKLNIVVTKVASLYTLNV